MTVVNMDIHCVGECNIHVAIPELMFEGLKTLAEEDKDVCFLRLDDLTVQAKKQSDLPTKFQRIHECWVAFEEPLDLIPSKVKKNKSKCFRLSIWLGSTMEPKELLGNCVMEWDDVRPNGGKVEISYKQMQVLNTFKNIILAGVPTDVDSGSLTRILRMGMEDARLRMVARNPSKFGAISLMPKFALVTDFVKYTPYKERSTETNPNTIPFWSKMPWHIECHTSDEPKIDALLSCMDCTNRLAQLFGEAAFHHVNLGPKATAGEHDTNAGVVT
jgi:hypothetical protein